MRKKEDKELLVLSQIREAIGCEHKSTLDELVGKIKALVKVAAMSEIEHAEIKKFMAGFGESKQCNCISCDLIRSVFTK